MANVEVHSPFSRVTVTLVPSRVQTSTVFRLPSVSAYVDTRAMYSRFSTTRPNATLRSHAVGGELWTGKFGSFRPSRLMSTSVVWETSISSATYEPSPQAELLSVAVEGKSAGSTAISVRASTAPELLLLPHASVSPPRRHSDRGCRCFCMWMAGAS